MKLDASSEEAQLHTAEADLELARRIWNGRAIWLRAKSFRKRSWTAAESTFKQKEGAVDNMRSMIAQEGSPRAVRRSAWHSPGQRRPNRSTAGQQVVQLTALDPVYVDFALPQQELSQLTPGLEVQVHTDAVPDANSTEKLPRSIRWSMRLRETSACRRRLQNPDHALRPGMFAKVEVILPEKHKDAGYSRIGDFLCALWRFGFRDREKEGRKDGQGIADRFGSNLCGSAKRAAILLRSRRD